VCGPWIANEIGPRAHACSGLKTTFIKKKIRTKNQAFHKPNSNSGVSNTITLLVVHLSELPLAVRITHRYTLGFFNVLVLDG